MPVPTIMLADNDRDFLETATEFLERKGYKVMCAGTPDEARRLLLTGDIAIAFIDYRLLREEDELDDSGLAVAIDTIRTSAIPKVILTKYSVTRYAVDAMKPRVGDKGAAVNFILKQDGLEKILEVIEDVLGRARIFLSYATPDRDQVLSLYQRLEEVGHVPWMDVVSIMGGERWDVAIRKAIKKTHFFVVCLSESSKDRRGFFQKEIRMALEVWDEMLEEDIYLFPIRLGDCAITHDRLGELQWIDMFEPDGFQRLVEAIRTGMSRRSIGR